MKKITLLLAVMLLSASCKTGLRIEKRLYTKGYNIEFPGRPVKTAEKNFGHVHAAKISLPPAATDSVPPPCVSSLLADTLQTAVEEKTLTGVKSSSKLTRVAQVRSMPYIPEEPVRLNDSPVASTPAPTTRGTGWMAGLLALATAGYCYATKERGKKISLWAKNNKAKARALLVAGHCGLGFGALYAGKWMYDYGIAISDAERNAWSVAFLAAALLYPVKRIPWKLFQHSYIKQKTADLALVVSGLYLLMATGNMVAAWDPAAPMASTEQTQNVTQRYRAFMLNHLKKVADAIYAQDDSSRLTEKAARPGGEGRESTGEQILKMILLFAAIAAFVLLISALGSLACELSCSGQEGLAVFVAVGGTALLILLLVLAMKAIFADWHKTDEKK